ncbi:hypothetical protein DSO57_1028837 [Entomophthora muscae]|uniref:Uncharacterized protein n=1 Tax=Entomophthora muscae TaxID=34485 RepID=A0ACC2U010_9FUNG|nr:hypothetical protein DSO57_1028837 [Entomophthora muscae]
MEETNPARHTPASSVQVPLKINFSNRLQTPHPTAPQIGRSPTLGASRRQMINNQRRFSVSCGSPSLASSSDPSLQKTNIGDSSARSKSPLGSAKIEPPTSAPMTSAYIERGEARRAREFNHKISFDALHQHYRAGGRSQNEPKAALNFIPSTYNIAYDFNFLASNSSSPSPPGSLSTPRSLGSLSQIPIQRWSVNQVCYWLKEVHLEVHIDAFRRKVIFFTRDKLHSFYKTTHIAIYLLASFKFLFYLNCIV